MIELSAISTSSGPFELTNIDLHVPTGAYGVLMGSTGCGKTTLLEAICGLLPVRSGRIVLGDRDVTSLSPAQRQIGYVPQDGALFPHLTVAGHLAFGPRIQGWQREAISQRVEELAEELGISQLLGRRPHGLSGGERQRVALGRALAGKPQTLLLDEPLSAVDEQTRDGLCSLLRSLPEASRLTVLHVTHSATEAERLATHRFQMHTSDTTPRIEAVLPPGSDPAHSQTKATPGAASGRTQPSARE